MASTYRYHDMGTPTLTTKFTYSLWVKRSGLGAIGTIASMWKDGNNHVVLRFNSNDSISFYNYSSSSIAGELVTNAFYRDTSAWYHIVAQFDSTQSTAGDRMKLYVNGERITSFTGTEAYPAQNNQPGANASGTDNYLGARGDGANYDGLMSHAHFVDGTAYAASTFGSTDATTGEWKINTSPTVTYGNNGFFMFKDDASLTDRSGNSNNFVAQSGTLTQTSDCPSNNFATLNPLAPPASGLDIRNGNTHVFNDDDNNAWQTVPATLGITPTAKIYWEIKCVNVWGSGSCEMHGIADLDTILQGLTGQASDSTAYAWRNDASFRTNGSTIGSTTWAVSYTTNDILMFALDNANGALYAGKNGTWLNSGNPTSGASKTGALSVTAGLNYAPHSELKYGSDKPAYNFGNGYYVTTAVSSAGTTASTPGIFEYDVPTGYQPLSTKGLNA